MSQQNNSQAQDYSITGSTAASQASELNLQGSATSAAGEIPKTPLRAPTPRVGGPAVDIAALEEIAEITQIPETDYIIHAETGEQMRPKYPTEDFDKWHRRAIDGDATGQLKPERTLELYRQALKRVDGVDPAADVRDDPVKAMKKVLEHDLEKEKKRMDKSNPLGYYQRPPQSSQAYVSEVAASQSGKRKLDEIQTPPSSYGMPPAHGMTPTYNMAAAQSAALSYNPASWPSHVDQRRSQSTHPATQSSSTLPSALQVGQNSQSTHSGIPSTKVQQGASQVGLGITQSSARASSSGSSASVHSQLPTHFMAPTHGPVEPSDTQTSYELQASRLMPPPPRPPPRAHVPAESAGPNRYVSAQPTLPSWNDPYKTGEEPHPRWLPQPGEDWEAYRRRVTKLGLSIQEQQKWWHKAMETYGYK